MLCRKPGCPGDMKYFKNVEADTEGYKCPICGFSTHIVAYELPDDEPNFDLVAECFHTDDNGCLCIDDNILDVYYSKVKD